MGGLIDKGPGTVQPTQRPFTFAQISSGGLGGEAPPTTEEEAKPDDETKDLRDSAPFGNRPQQRVRRSPLDNRAGTGFPAARPKPKARQMRFALILLALSASPALAELQLASQVRGLDLVDLSTLPAAPPPSADTEFCAHLFIATPATPGGQDAAAKGWHVTAEETLGDFIAVSFIGSAIPATSGTCELVDGNVGLYSGSQIVALLYATQPEELRIGSLRPFGDGLRILSGDVVPGTSADLVAKGEQVTLTAPASEEPVCNGTAVVPGVEGLPIDTARKLLIAAGWQPVPGDPAQQALGFAQEIAARGVPEVEDCSGTGFGFCGYTYAGGAGSLSVTTVGEGSEDGGLPVVSGYGVDCGPG